jgi:cytoskeletal protein CcmA (bactofilin family)
MKKTLLAVFVSFALIMLPLAALGAEFRADKNGYYLNDSAIASDNLYVASQNVTIYGTAQKDVFAVASNVIVEGDIDQDLFAAGGMISITGSVGDDVRVGGGTVSLGGSVGGELIAAGGQVNVLESAEISKDALIGGGNIDFNGVVHGNLASYGSRVYINGQVDGTLKINAREVVIGPKAVIKGDFNYSSGSEASIADGAKILGKKNFTPIEYRATVGKTTGAFFGFTTALWLIKLLALVVAALVIFFVFRQGAADLVRHAASNFWKELLRGFVLFFIIPIASLIAIVTIIGVIPALIALAIYVLMLILGAVFAGLLSAGFIAKWFFKKADYSLEWYTIVLGIAALAIVKMIPFVGWIAGAAVFLAALGTLYGGLYVKFEPRRK